MQCLFKKKNPLIKGAVEILCPKSGKSDNINRIVNIKQINPKIIANKFNNETKKQDNNSLYV